MYDAHTGREVHSLEVQHLPGAAAFTPDGSHIVNKQAGGLGVWDVDTARQALTFAVPEPILLHCDESQQESPLATLGSEIVRVFDMPTGHEIVALRVQAGPPPTTVFSPDGLRLAMTAPEGALRMFDLRTERKLSHSKGRNRSASPVFSPDGSRIAAVDRNGTATRLFDTVAGQQVLTFSGRTVHPPVFSPDGKRHADSNGKVWAAPDDPAAWQAERRTGLADTAAACHRVRAQQSELAGHWFAAAFHLKRICADEPANPRPFFRRSTALSHLGKAEPARQSFDKAVAVTKKNPPADKAEQVQLQTLAPRTRGAVEEMSRTAHAAERSKQANVMPLTPLEDSLRAEARTGK